MKIEFIKKFAGDKSVGQKWECEDSLGKSLIKMGVAKKVVNRKAKK